MKPKYLFHGTGILIKGRYLLPYRPSDKGQKAVYATERKDIAIGMALTTGKYITSFGDYRKKPFKVIFIRGKPKKPYVYVYTISSKSFTEQPKKSHQWISKIPVKILSKQKYLVKNLNSYWRKANQKDKEFYCKKKGKKELL